MMQKKAQTMELVIKAVAIAALLVAAAYVIYLIGKYLLGLELF